MTADELREKVMRLKPNNFMAMGGAGAGIIGGSNTGGDVILQLQRATIEFVKLFKSTDADETVSTSAQQVEGLIMMAATTDVISQSEADKLLDNLEQVMKERG